MLLERRGNPGQKRTSSGTCVAAKGHRSKFLIRRRLIEKAPKEPLGRQNVNSRHELIDEVVACGRLNAHRHKVDLLPHPPMRIMVRNRTSFDFRCATTSSERRRQASGGTGQSL